MAQNLIQKLPPELCNHINLFNLHKYNFNNCMKNLVEIYWTKWIHTFSKLDSLSISRPDYNYYYMIYEKNKDIVYDEIEYNHRIIFRRNQLYEQYHGKKEDIRYLQLD